MSGPFVERGDLARIAMRVTEDIAAIRAHVARRHGEAVADRHAEAVRAAWHLAFEAAGVYEVSR